MVFKAVGFNLKRVVVFEKLAMASLAIIIALLQL
jgi:hypothetical protein